MKRKDIAESRVRAQVMSLGTTPFWVGIDPGLSGGIAVLDDFGQLAGWTRMPIHKVGPATEPDASEILDFLKAIHAGGNVRAAIEKVHAMPRQGVVSMFSFGKGFGILLGIIGTLGWPPRRVRPQDWQSWAFSSERPWASAVPAEGNTKTRANAAAVAAWPCLEDTLKTKANQGIADAALIAEYARTASG